MKVLLTGVTGYIGSAVLDALPPDRMTQVRVPKYKRWVLEQPGVSSAQERFLRGAWHRTVRESAEARKRLSPR